MKPTVHVCGGSDCQKQKKAGRKLAALLDGHAGVEVVGCQKVCDGPVVGLEVRGRLEWFGEIRGGEVRRALSRWLQDGRIRKPHRKRRVKKRSGKLR